MSLSPRPGFDVLVAFFTRPAAWGARLRAARLAARRLLGGMRTALRCALTAGRLDPRPSSCSTSVAVAMPTTRPPSTTGRLPISRPRMTLAAWRSVMPGVATATREIVMAQGMINNRQFDMARIDVAVALGATEIWEVQNVVGMDHPFHLHGFFFQPLAEDGSPAAPLEWLDTFNVPKMASRRFAVSFDNRPGMWMFHCHILDHSDAGMMGMVDLSR